MEYIPLSTFPNLRKSHLQVIGKPLYLLQEVHVLVVTHMVNLCGVNSWEQKRTRSKMAHRAELGSQTAPKTYFSIFPPAFN